MIMTNVMTACSDTVIVQVECINCPPIHNYPVDQFGAVVFDANDCNADTLLCLNITAANINNYVITDNDTPITAFENCASDSTLCYNYFTLPGAGQNGPYTVAGWVVNGTPYPSATVSNLQGLVTYMNSVDTSGWTLDPATMCISSANADPALYGPMPIDQNGAMVTSLMPSLLPGNNLGIRLDTGFHFIQITDTTTTCGYVIQFQLDCPSIQVADSMFVSLPENSTLTVCVDTSIVAGPYISMEDVCANSNTNVSFTTDLATGCIEITGLQIGQDTICLQVCDANGDCFITNVYVTVTPAPDTITINVQTGTQDTICFNSTGLDIVSISNYCESSSGNVVFFDTIAGTNCVIFDALLPGQDTACMVYCYNNAGTTICDTTILIVNSVPTSIDTVYINLLTGEDSVYCASPGNFIGDVTISNYCPSTGTAVAFTINNSSNCIEIEGIEPGDQTGCFVICDQNYCDTVILIVSVNDLPIGPEPMALPDYSVTQKNTPIGFSIIQNDTIYGVANNLLGLDTVIFSAGPKFGTINYDPLTGQITYTPDNDSCGIDTFSYLIRDLSGRSDTTTVVVKVLCEKIFVYTGLSPNGDMVNDTWIIDGIEAYPNNDIKVYNRWGNLVHHTKGYKNATAWDLRWEGKDLPDGTYFYLIDLGDGDAPFQGYLQILR